MECQSMTPQQKSDFLTEVQQMLDSGVMDPFRNRDFYTRLQLACCTECDLNEIRALLPPVTIPIGNIEVIPKQEKHPMQFTFGKLLEAEIFAIPFKVLAMIAKVLKKPRRMEGAISQYRLRKGRNRPKNTIPGQFFKGSLDDYLTKLRVIPLRYRFRMWPCIDKKMTEQWITVLKFIWQKGYFDPAPCDLAMACYIKGWCMVGNTMQEEMLVIPFREVVAIMKAIYESQDLDLPIHYFSVEQKGIKRLQSAIARVKLERG